MKNKRIITVAMVGALLTAEDTLSMPIEYSKRAKDL
jgi:hypothetical protein